MVGNLERFGSVDVMLALPFSTRNVLSLPTATGVANYPVIRICTFHQHDQIGLHDIYLIYGCESRHRHPRYPT